MKVRLIKSLPNLDGLDIEAVFDIIENSIIGKLYKCIDRNIMSYDSDGDRGELTHKLMETTNENNLDCGRLVLIEVGECLTKLYLADECSFPANKSNVAIFTYENGQSMIGAY